MFTFLFELLIVTIYSKFHPVHVLTSLETEFLMYLSYLVCTIYYSTDKFRERK